MYLTKKKSKARECTNIGSLKKKIKKAYKKQPPAFFFSGGQTITVVLNLNMLQKKNNSVRMFHLVQIPVHDGTLSFIQKNIYSALFCLDRCQNVTILHKVSFSTHNLCICNM